MRKQFGWSLVLVLWQVTVSQAQEMTPLPEGASARLGSHRLRVPGTMDDFALMPDGRSVIVAFHDATGRQRHVTVFDVATGFPRQHVVFNKSFHLALARDQPRVAVNTGDHIEVWDVDKAERVKRWAFDELSTGLYSIVLSPDANWVVAHVQGFGKPNLVRWDLNTGKSMSVGSIELNRKIQFSADSSKFFVITPTMNYADGSKTKIVRGEITAWETKTGQKLLSLRNDSNYVVIAPDGTRAARSDQKTVEVFDLSGTGESFSLAPAGYSFAFTPDGKQLIMQDRDGLLQRWDLASKKIVKTLEGAVHAGSFHPQFSADGKLLGVVNEYLQNGAILLFDMASGKIVRYSTGHPSTVNGLAYAPAGKLLATFSGDVLLLHDPATGKELRRWIAHQSSIEQIAFSPDGKLLASASVDGTIGLWDPITGLERKRLAAKDSVKSIAFTRDGAHLISVTSARSIQTWDLTKGTAIRTLVAPEGFTAPALSPTGQYLTCFGGAMRARNYEPGKPVDWLNVRTGKTLKPMVIGPPLNDANQFGIEGNIVWELAFSPDGKLCATCDSLQTQGLRVILSSHTVRLWESATQREILRLTGLPAFTRVIAISPDHRILAHGVGGRTGFGWGEANSALVLRDISAAQDIALPDPNRQPGNKLEDPAKGLRKISGHLGAITCAAFSPDGKFLATGGTDSVVYLWPIKEEIQRPDGKSSAEAAALWPLLADADARKAYRAIAGLERMPKEALALVRKHVKPVPAADATAVAQQLRDLSSASFATRQRALMALETMGEQAPDLLEAALKAPRDLENTRRLELLLDKINNPFTDPNRLRNYRCLSLLERIGTAESRRLLTELAQGAPTAWFTIEARHSLPRSDSRE